MIIPSRWEGWRVENDIFQNYVIISYLTKKLLHFSLSLSFLHSFVLHSFFFRSHSLSPRLWQHADPHIVEALDVIHFLQHLATHPKWATAAITHNLCLMVGINTHTHTFPYSLMGPIAFIQYMNGILILSSESLTIPFLVIRIHTATVSDDYKLQLARAPRHNVWPKESVI